jgi:hypothetical protein
MKPVHHNQPFDEKRSTKPAGVEYWDVSTLGVPRRSITGAFVWGRVWRRRDRGRWQYASIDTLMTPLPTEDSEIKL